VLDTCFTSSGARRQGAQLILVETNHQWKLFSACLPAPRMQVVVYMGQGSWRKPIECGAKGGGRANGRGTLALWVHWVVLGGYIYDKFYLHSLIASLTISIPQCVCLYTYLSVWVCLYTNSKILQRDMYEKFQKHPYFFKYIMIIH
jgi:hypothetical protein